MNPLFLPYDILFAYFESKDDGYRDTRTPTFGRVESDNLRDSSLSSQTPYSHPSSKFWGLYLSQAERIDKEQSDSWTANTDGVLVFVRHKSYQEIVLFSP